MATSSRQPTVLPTSPEVHGVAPVATGQLPAPASQKPAIWLNGDVLACACPECHALMSIRAWLMVGDCSHCGTSVELSEEQEQEARRLLEQREQAASPAVPVEPSPMPLAPAVAKPEPTNKQSRPAQKPTEAPAPAPRKPAAKPKLTGLVIPTPPEPKRPPALPAGKVPAAAVPTAAQARVYKLATFGSAKVLLHDMLHDLPAWMVSLVFHLVLIMLLGMWMIEHKVIEPEIVLSATIGAKHKEGEPGVHDPTKDEVEFEQPGKPPKDAKQAQIEAVAKKDAEELQVPQNAPAVNLPKMTAVLSAMKAPGSERMFEGRDPRVRATVVNHEGGTTFSEAAVARGLRWLSKHQSADGHWGLNSFQHSGECRGQCGGAGGDSDTGGTALAILPFLGAGQTHLQGRYTEAVGKGLKWLADHQLPNGDLRGGGIGRMYAHGQAAIVLCEAYAISGDLQLHEPAQRAVNYIVAAQHPAGGWRYNPGEDGDTSVVGWQLMALRSAKMAGFEVPEKSLELASKFLDSVKRDDVGALYAYQPGAPPSPAMTAEALLCREYLGWPVSHIGLQAGAEALVRDHLPKKAEPNIYYWYYATQALHHIGGESWEKWNQAMRETLVSMQETEGHQAGSWSPAGGAIGNHDTQTGGRIYMTSLAICTLEVYYRHLPIYRTIKLDAKAKR